MVETTTPVEFPASAIDAAHRQTMLVTGAIATSLIVYAVVAEVLQRAQPQPPVVGGGDMIRIVAFIVAGVAIFTATVVKSVMLRNTPATAEARLARLRAASIVSVAFAEMPAVLGFAIFIISRSRPDFYVLLVVSLYMIVRHFPKRDAWETYVRRGTDSR